MQNSSYKKLAIFNSIIKITENNYVYLSKFIWNICIFAGVYKTISGNIQRVGKIKTIQNGR